MPATSRPSLFFVTYVVRSGLRGTYIYSASADSARAEILSVYTGSVLVKVRPASLAEFITACHRGS